MVEITLQKNVAVKKLSSAWISEVREKLTTKISYAYFV